MTNITYKDIAQAFELERNVGRINNTLLKPLGLQFPEVVTKQELITYFNQTAEHVGLEAKKDPVGFFALEDSVHKALKDIYLDVYEEKLDEIERGLSMGTTYAIEGVLSKLDNNIWNDVKEFLPEGSKYSDLRFVPMDMDIEEVMYDFVKARMRLTVAHSIKRAYDKSTLMELRGYYEQHGKRLAQTIYPEQINNLEL